MPLNANRTSADFTFKHTGQVDEYGASVGDIATVQGNFDSRAEDNLTDINNVKDYIRSDIATKTELAEAVISGLAPDSIEDAYLKQTGDNLLPNFIAHEADTAHVGGIVYAYKNLGGTF